MPKNLQRDDLLRHAQETLKRFPGALVFFKYACERCGERVMFDRPNYLFEEQRVLRLRAPAEGNGRRLYHGPCA